MQSSEPTDPTERALPRDGASGQTRPKDYLLLAGYALAVVALALPVAGPMWSGDASWFGLPRSIVWVVAVLSWVFGLLVVHFRSDAE